MTSSQRSLTGLLFLIDLSVPENRLTFERFAYFRDYIRPTGYVQKVPYNWYRCSCGNKTAVRKGLAGVHVFSSGCVRRETRIRMNAEGNRGPREAPAHNKGKIYVKDNPQGEKYVTPERHDAMYYGLEGEIHSLRVREAPNKGKKFVDGKYL